jgi:hypothetical protein
MRSKSSKRRRSKKRFNPPAVFTCVRCGQVRGGLGQENDTCLLCRWAAR